MGKIILWILAALLGLCLLYVLFLTVCALLVDTKKEYEHDSPFYRRLLYGATACCIRLLHIHIHVDGMEKLPKDGRFLLVCNHRSNFDPILTWQVMKERNLAFVSKAENFQIRADHQKMLLYGHRPGESPQRTADDREGGEADSIRRGIHRHLPGGDAQ